MTILNTVGKVALASAAGAAIGAVAGYGVPNAYALANAWATMRLHIEESRKNYTNLRSQMYFEIFKMSERNTTPISSDLYVSFLAQGLQLYLFDNKLQSKDLTKEQQNQFFQKEIDGIFHKVIEKVGVDLAEIKLKLAFKDIPDARCPSNVGWQLYISSFCRDAESLQRVKPSTEKDN